MVMEMNNPFLCLMLLFISGGHGTTSSSPECCDLSCDEEDSSHCTANYRNVLIFKCKESLCCAERLTNRDGSLQNDSLALSISYPTSEGPTLSANWEFISVPQSKLKVTVSFGQENKVLCYYLDGTTTQLRVTHLPNPFSYEYLCKGYNVTVQVYLGSHQGGGINSLTKTIFVEDCWSVMGNRSLEVCGVQIPSPPVNISAVLSVNSSSNVSTLRVTWDPPLHHNTPIQYYLIVVMDTGGNPWPVYEAVPQANSTENVFPYHWDGSQQLVVKVRAGVASTNSLCAYCLAKSISGETYYFGVHGTSDVSIVIQDPPTSMQAKPQEKSLEGNIIAVLVMGGLFIVFLLMKFAMCL